MIKLLEYFPEKPWSWVWLSGNPNITFDMVLAHPEIPWNWDRLSQNKFKLEPTLRFVKARKIQRQWRWTYLKRKASWILKTRKICFEIKYLPGFGIEFQGGRERFTNAVNANK